MRETEALLKQWNKTARKSAAINTILWLIVMGLVGIAFYTSYVAWDAKKQAEISEATTVEALKIVQSQKEELRISEENLKGEKEKLELIKAQYDSLREVQLASENDLWNYTVELNTVQGYLDYYKIKGDDGKDLVGKVDALLTRVGYVQMEESDGTRYFRDAHAKGAEKFRVALSTRSVRSGVIGRSKASERTGEVILEGQPVRILRDSIMSGKARWAKVRY